MLMLPIDSRLRLVLLLAGILVGVETLARSRVDGVAPAADGESLDAAIRRNVALILADARDVQVADPDRDVAWVGAPSGNLGVFDTTRSWTFVALAAPRPGAPRDLYRMEAKVTPFGTVFDARWIVNLSRTAGADDAALAVQGTRVATAVRYAGRVTAIEVRDLAGEDPERAGTAEWGRIRRAGNALTNLQETGAAAGIELDHYMVQGEGPPNVSLVFEEGRLHVLDPTSDTPAATLTLADRQLVGSLPLAHLPAQRKMKYEFLNWLADTGRGFADQGIGPSWAGNSIELMKEVYFKAKEVQADIEEVTESAEPVVQEAPEVVEEAIERARFQAQGASLPWPPPPLEPMLGEREKGEGLWEVIPPDQVTYQENAPPPMYKTFIRPDPDYGRKRVYIMVWDPAQVSLKMRAGTTNPVPQTGHRGDGRIPREPETLKRVVGGFNGGFQTAHIWYGMMVDSKVLLRPREYGATAGSWEDGRTAFGTWPPGADIPEGLTHYRQNLPPLIEDGVFNPYKRRTWGWHKKVAGAVEGKTIRTALCYTRDDYVMYFYTEFADEHVLASTLFHCGCRYAIHLDMNRGHSGFEHYKLLAEGDDASGEDVREVEGLRFRGRVLHPTNQHMKAPTRYLGVDYRDFFYLQLRDVLPGPNLAPLRDGSEGGAWSTTGLAHNAEFPPRAARTTLSAGEGSVQVLLLDPRGLDLTALPAEGEVDREHLMATVPLPEGGPKTLAVGDLSLSGRVLASDDAAPVPAATAVGIDPAGFVVLALLRNAAPADAARVMAQRGVSEAIWGPTPGDRPVLAYQAIKNDAGQPALIELPLGADEGQVVAEPRRDGPRMQLRARERAPRIVRLFPDMKPEDRTRRRPNRR